MASKTSEVTKYEVRIGNANLTIIDTPGLGDSRGTLQDEENFKKIKEVVLEEGGINCVFVV